MLCTPLHGKSCRPQCKFLPISVTVGNGYWEESGTRVPVVCLSVLMVVGVIHRHLYINNKVAQKKSNKK